MKPIFPMLAAVCALAAPILCAAAPTDELGRFAGTWQSKGLFVQTAYSDAGTATATTVCAWSNSRTFMICQQSVTIGGKLNHAVAIYTYDDASNSYHFYNVQTSRTTSSTIVVAGNKITYPFTFSDKGKDVTIRTVNVWANPNLYNWRTEYSTDGGATWTLMASGSSKKM